MFVYRISQTKYANHLIAPGISGRWNSEGQKMLYTAGSAALACLENLVHRSGAAINAGNFSIASIQIDDQLKIETITYKMLMDLEPNWTSVNNYPITQKIGDTWLNEARSAILKVPSAIIDLEYNYLLNPGHTDFSKIKIAEVNAFTFDSRLKLR